MNDNCVERKALSIASKDTNRLLDEAFGHPPAKDPNLICGRLGRLY